MGLKLKGPLKLSGALQLSGSPLGLPSQVANVSPANGTAHVDYLPTISWQNGGGALTYKVYFDTSNPPTTLVQNSSATSYSPSALSFSTVYYLRIDSVNNSGTTTGTVYSFTTEPAFDVDFYMPLDVAGADGDTLTAAAINASDVLPIGTWDFDTFAASALLAGGIYKIISAGTSDLTLVGASSNSPGTIFTATGPTTGSAVLVCPRVFVSGSPKALYSPYKHGETIYRGTTATNAIKFGGETCGNTITAPFTTPVDTLVLTGWLRIGALAASNPNAPDLIQIRHNTSGWVVLGFHPNGYFYFENGPLGTSYNVYGISTGNWYHFCIKGGKNGVAGQTHQLRVCAADGITELGSVAFDCSGNSTGQFNKLQIGRLDNHHAGNQPSTDSYIEFAQLGINTSAVSFPVGP